MKKKSKEVTNNYNGVGALSVLQIMLVGLKLGNVIAWSWWLVMLPYLSALGLSMILVLGILVYVVATK